MHLPPSLSSMSLGSENGSSRAAYGSAEYTAKAIKAELSKRCPCHSRCADHAACLKRWTSQVPTLGRPAVLPHHRHSTSRMSGTMHQAPCAWSPHQETLCSLAANPDCQVHQRHRYCSSPNPEGDMARCTCTPSMEAMMVVCATCAVVGDIGCTAKQQWMCS
jgi:hypothetical protein